MGIDGWRLSAFGDEISNDLVEQLQTLRSLGIGHLELRGAWGKNVLHLSDEEVKIIRSQCEAQGIAVSAIGSPVGKSPITEPLSKELENLKRIFSIADQLGTRLVRVFSFYLPDSSHPSWSEEELVKEATARLAAMTAMAGQEGFLLLLENESGIVGDTISRCQTLLDALPSSHLRFAWDPGNFVAVGERTAVTDGWLALGSRTSHVHIKDYRMATREILPVGEGDGQMDLLLQRLAVAKYEGFLALEPHLKVAGKSSGFSGPDGMARAATGLRLLLARLGLAEAVPDWATGARP